MSAAKMVRTYVGRFLGLGWARVFLVIGVVFTLLAMASPIWAMTVDHGGGDYTTSTFGWTTRTDTSYQAGVWSDTFIQSYNARGFPLNAIANSMGASYIVLLVFLFVLIAAIALYSIEWVHRLPALGLLIIALVIVVFAFVALLYPIFTVPGAAASDYAISAISGFWGSVGVSPTTTRTWGAGLGWWFLLIALIFGIVGGVWPFLKTMRQPMVRAPPPREWQVER